MVAPLLGVLACERPPRLRRYGGFATLFLMAQQSPPYEGGDYYKNPLTLLGFLASGLQRRDVFPDVPHE